MTSKRLIPFAAATLALGLIAMAGGAPVGSASTESQSQATTSQQHSSVASHHSVVRTSKATRVDSLPSVSTASSANRRATGNGTLRFRKGESVDGVEISYRNPDGSWGKTFYICHITHAARAGRVRDGVINYYRNEVNSPACSSTQSSPGPRHPTGDGNWSNFQAGDFVIGYAIEINLGASGRTYFGCLLKPAGASGRVISGVVDPSRFEMKDKTRCGNTSDWRPGFRTESGNGSLHFQAGDWVVAAYIAADDGRTFSGNGNGCYIRGASFSGTLYGGVRNFWPGEESTLPAC